MKPFFYQMFSLLHCTTINKCYCYCLTAAAATATTSNQRVSDTAQIYCDARQKYLKDCLANSTALKIKYT